MERLVTLADVEELTEFFYRPIKLDLQLLLKKADALLVSNQLMAVIKKLTDGSWSVTEIEKQLRTLQAEHDWHKGQFFMMLRLTVTGKKATPPLFEMMAVLGKDENLKRLMAAAKL